VLTFLGLGHGEVALAACLDSGNDRSNHVTSGSVDESVGRWRTSLSQSQIELANWFFEPFTRRFGYSN